MRMSKLATRYKIALVMLAVSAVTVSAQLNADANFSGRASLLPVSAVQCPPPGFNPAAHPNLLKNPSFELVGPNGPATTITTNVPGGAGNSAAANWTLFTNVAGTIHTQLLPSTKPGGGARMIHVVTNGDRNGLVQVFGPFNTGPAQTVASAWVYVRKGKVGIGTGNGGNTGIDALTVTQGKWEYLQACNGASPANEFIVYSVEGGADFYVDLTRVVAVREKTPGRRPDLIPRISAPPIAKAGVDIGPLVKLAARNIGGAPAPGTTGALDPANGYMIDVVLSKDMSVPPGFATFSPGFLEDALLQGARTSITADLAPGAMKFYPTGARIPANTPTGSYFLCARIDPGGKVAESNEANNVACRPIKVIGNP